jgi:hypothetical protein
MYMVNPFANKENNCGRFLSKKHGMIIRIPITIEGPKTTKISGTFNLTLRTLGSTLIKGLKCASFQYGDT